MRMKPNMGWRLSLFVAGAAWLLWNAQSRYDNNNNADEGAAMVQSLFTWLKHQGGYIHDHIHVRRISNKDNSNDASFGLFATQTITEGQAILVIPQHCQLESFSGDVCDMTASLLNQLESTFHSNLSPYLSYLFPRDSAASLRITNRLPSAWSSEGKELLNKIQGPNLWPRSLTSSSFVEDCGGSTGDPLEDLVYSTVVSRALSDPALFMVPGADLMLHHSCSQSRCIPNVDTAPIQEDGNIFVYATRDIPAGKQILQSSHYSVSEVLRDAGVVDPYPQRWNFPVEPNVIFDLDFVDQEQRALYESGALVSTLDMSVTWHTGKPALHQIELMKADLTSLEQIGAHVFDAAQELKSEYERNIALQYYNALLLALMSATRVEKTVVAEACFDSNNDVKLCDSEQVSAPSENKWLACDNYTIIGTEYKTVHVSKSQYQGIYFHYNKAQDDMCMYLDHDLHTCASFRPHYHEVVVHYPARYLDQVKRVIYIGGGDSMVLHEVLKYNSLELVVGLELDQDITRSSFLHFGAQPHFDNEKVQWYFGDAAKSLLVLPKDYYGSFDLVIVDVLTVVAQTLKVSQDLTLMGAAMLLMKPDGIIIRNEDEGYIPGSIKNFTKFTLELVYQNVPLYCMQEVVMGSNSIDFLSAQPLDHHVDTFFLKGLDQFQSQFDRWYNFGTNYSWIDTHCPASHEFAQGATSEFEDRQPLGVLLVLEAEQTQILLEPQAVELYIVNALRVVDLAQTRVLRTEVSDSEVSTFSLAILLGNHGIVIARCVSDWNYCAFDVQLYGNSIAKIHRLQKELAKTISSKLSSAFFMVTGGMEKTPEEEEEEEDENAKEEEEYRNIGPPSVDTLCSKYQRDTVYNDQTLRQRYPIHDLEPPHATRLHDYNTSAALAQWDSQTAVGTQVVLQFQIPLYWPGETVHVWHRGAWSAGTIDRVHLDQRYDVQLVINETHHVMATRVRPINMRRVLDVSRKKLVSPILEELIRLATMDTQEAQVIEPVRDGLVVAAVGSEYTAVATWNGQTEVTLVLFGFFLDTHHSWKNDMVHAIRHHPRFSLDHWNVTLADEFPRGYGSVVLFPKDMSDEPPAWV